MTDEAALMLAFSDLVRQCRNAGLISVAISCGQALGGDLEAVGLHSGLLAARLVAEADVAIVSIGPGTVGTDTALGHTGIAQAEALNAVQAVGGIPIAALRVSSADQRPRHFGVSHHSLTALRDTCLAKARIALPRPLATELQPHEPLPLEQPLPHPHPRSPQPHEPQSQSPHPRSPQSHEPQSHEPSYFAAKLIEALALLELDGQHDLVDVEIGDAADISAALAAAGIRVTTMGRSEREDPAFFRFAYAAGVLAGQLANERRAAHNDAHNDAHNEAHNETSNVVHNETSNEAHNEAHNETHNEAQSSGSPSKAATR
jgi:hypothetical protein